MGPFYQHHVICFYLTICMTYMELFSYLTTNVLERLAHKTNPAKRAQRVCHMAAQLVSFFVPCPCPNKSRLALYSPLFSFPCAQHHTQLLEILEIPQLMETLVRNGMLRSAFSSPLVVSIKESGWP